MTVRWYENSFKEDYLTVYRHRDHVRARAEMQTLVQWLGWRAPYRVLDLCCGTGRHAYVLHDLGLTVTGVDLSETLLTQAQLHANNRDIRWIHGDMRHVPLHEAFDGIVNLFTSFGYFEEDAQNESVLQEMSRLLCVNGQCVIDFLNAPLVAAQLQPYSIRTLDATTIEEWRTIDARFVYKKIVIASPGEQPRQYEERVRLYTVADFEAMFVRCGLTVTRIAGNYDGATYAPQHSPRLIVVGKKTA